MAKRNRVKRSKKYANKRACRNMIMVDGQHYGLEAWVKTSHDYIVRLITAFKDRYNADELNNLVKNNEIILRGADQMFRASNTTDGACAVKLKGANTGAIDIKLIDWQEFCDRIVDYAVLRHIAYGERIPLVKMI